MNDNLDEFYKEDGIQCIFCRHVCFDLLSTGTGAGQGILHLPAPSKSGNRRTVRTGKNNKRMALINSNEGRIRMGAALRAHREAKGLSCEEVANMVGVTRQTISKIEIGKWNAGADHLAAIADALGCEWILKEKGK